MSKAESIEDLSDSPFETAHLNEMLDEAEETQDFKQSELKEPKEIHISQEFTLGQQAE